MSTPGPAPNVSLVHEPSAADGLNPEMAAGSKRPVSRAYVILAALGWLAAGFSFWHQSTGQEPPPTPPAAQGEDREKTETEVKATQQKLATAQSALAVTTRLRDEAAQALQEVKERSAGANNDLAAARSELDDIQQKIAVQTSELKTITMRLDTARRRDSQEKQKADATPVTAATAGPPSTPAPAVAPPATASKPGERSRGVNRDLQAARSELDDIRRQIAARNSELAAITKRLDTTRSQEALGRKQAEASPTATAAIPPAAIQPVETPPKSIDRNASPIA